MTILDEIIAEKEKEVMQLKKETIAYNAPAYDGPTFQELITNRNTMGMIAEMKHASPSKGMIHPNVDPKAQARSYEKYGTKAISVLIDGPFFKVMMEELNTVQESVYLPI